MGVKLLEGWVCHDDSMVVNSHLVGTYVVRL